MKKRLIKKISINKIFFPAIFLSLFLFTLVSIKELKFPWLHRDEVFFIHTAREMKWHCCGAGAGGWWEGVRFFILPYLGALKAWLYILIFEIFGSSLFSIRFTMFVFTCAALITFSIFLRRIFSEWAALMALFLVILNPAVWIIARQDIGELAMYSFFMAGVLLSVQSGLKWNKKVHWAMAAVLLALGGYHRLNFFWFSFPFLLVSIYAFRKSWRPLLALVMVNAGVAATFLKFSTIATRQEFFIIPLDLKLRSAIRELDGLLSGRVATDRIFLPKFPEVEGMFWVFPIALTALLLFYSFFRNRTFDRKWILVLGATFFGIVAAFMVSKRAESYWHIYPAWLLLIFILSALLGPWLADKKGRIWALLAISPILFSYGKQHLRFSYAKENLIPRYEFSDAALILAKECMVDEVRCYFLEGDIFLPVVALLPESKLATLLPNFLQKTWTVAREEILQILENPANRFVFLDRNFEKHPNIGDYFLDVTKTEGFAVSENKEVRDSKGRVVFRLVRFKRVLK